MSQPARVVRPDGGATRLHYAGGRLDTTIHAPAASMRLDSPAPPGADTLREFRRAVVELAEFMPGTIFDVPVFDPRRPELDPNALLEEMGGRKDPRAMNHHCGLCCTHGSPEACERDAMRWELFLVHLPDCWRRYQRSTMQPRTWQGFTPGADR